MILAPYQKWANDRILKAICKMRSDDYFKDIKLHPMVLFMQLLIT